MYDEYAVDFCYGFADAQEVFRIRGLVNLLLESNATSLNLDRAVVIIDEITSRGPLGCHAVLGAIYERLYRRKGLYLALELLEFCVRNCGMDFAVFLRRPFLKAMTRLLQLKSLTEQTFVGQVNSTMKMLIKKSKKHVVGEEPSPTPKTMLRSTDVVLTRCQRKVLYLIQLWADAFMMYEDRVPDIFEIYRKLRRKGYPFPPRDVQQRYLIKHAENSPAFICGDTTSSQQSMEKRFLPREEEVTTSTRLEHGLHQSDTTSQEGTQISKKTDLFSKRETERSNLLLTESSDLPTQVKKTKSSQLDTLLDCGVGNPNTSHNLGKAQESTMKNKKNSQCAKDPRSLTMVLGTEHIVKSPTPSDSDAPSQTFIPCIPPPPTFSSKQSDLKNDLPSNPEHNSIRSKSIDMTSSNKDVQSPPEDNPNATIQHFRNATSNTSRYEAFDDLLSFH